MADRVDLRLQPALDGLKGLDGVYDLAFLDAIKSEYAAYTDWCCRCCGRAGC